MGGTVTANGDGTITYIPPSAGFTGTDAFTYTVLDGSGGTATATVTVQVVAPPVLAPAISSQPGLVVQEQFLALSSGNSAGVFQGTVGEFGEQAHSFALLTTGSTSVATGMGPAGVDNGSATTFAPGS